MCKGKIFEGLNFKDNLGRMVVVVGIPLAAIGDPKIKNKIKYKNKIERGSGEEWYTKEGMRAVNQAIGRLIRDS